MNKCALITCEDCQLLDNITCPYENKDNSDGNIYETIYDNKRIMFMLVKANDKDYLIDLNNRIEGTIGPFDNAHSAEEWLMKNAVLIDKNKGSIFIADLCYCYPSGAPRKSDLYKKHFIKY